MSDRSLRGMRLGSQSKETEAGIEPAPRQIVEYKCSKEHETKIPFSTEADIPATWPCSTCGETASLVNGEATAEEEDNEKTVRTHWDMLLERRTPEELEQILEDRLTILREKRKAALQSSKD
ncbi:MAG: RNA polymerase-binding protein RbpA [Micrococcaceae bacterium]